MEIPTIVLLALIAVIAGLTVVVGRAHGDMTRAVQRMDQSVEACNRSAAACEHAANSCLGLAEQVRELVTAVLRQPPREPAE
jgi:hypothetical protein